MSAAHTPGPWERCDRDMTSINAGPKHIAMVNWYKTGGQDDVSGSEHEANASLILSAPDLLAALQLVIKEGLPVGPGYEPVEAAARAAIAKATGAA